MSKNKLKLSEKTKSQIEDLIFASNRNKHREPTAYVNAVKRVCFTCDGLVPIHAENEFYCTENCRKISKAWFAFKTQ